MRCCGLSAYICLAAPTLPQNKVLFTVTKETFSRFVRAASIRSQSVTFGQMDHDEPCPTHLQIGHGENTPKGPENRSFQ